MTTRHLFHRCRVLPLVLAIAAFAGGCTVGPNYKRPDLKPPEQYRGLVGAASAQSLADVPWWEVFSDPVLKDLINEGIANNLDLKVASARVVEARATAGIAKSFLYPDIGVSFGFSSAQQSRLPRA